MGRAAFDEGARCENSAGLQKKRKKAMPTFLLLKPRSQPRLTDGCWDLN